MDKIKQGKETEKVINSIRNYKKSVSKKIKLKKEQNKKLSSENQQLLNIIEFLPDAIFVINKDRKVIAWNHAIEEMTGIKKEKIIGKGNYAYAEAFYKMKRPLIADYILGADFDVTKLYDFIEKKKATYYAETYVKSLYHGKGAYVWVIASPLYDNKGNIAGAIESVRDITSKKKYEKDIKFLSFHDKLTGLYNRNFIEMEIKRLDTKRQLPLCVIIGDVNNLKLTNDVFGHHKGDILLVKTARILKESCRAEDIISRWGGDEFVIFLPKTSEKDALEIVQRIKDTCNRLMKEPISPSIALGLAIKTDTSQSINKILIEAEDRMYRNKFIEEKSTRSSFIAILEKSLWERSHETQEHTERLQKMVLQIGKFFELSNDQLDELILLATLHDIGKISIPDDILLKPAKLTADEWNIMVKHVETGYRIAQSHYALNIISEAILSHHEHWDGKGYPQGLKGTQIPLTARILAVADAYDVMTNGRPYKKIMTMEEALQELIRGKGTQFDPDIVNIFINLQKDLKN